MTDTTLATARQHLEAGRLAQAESLCRQILRDQPNHADTWQLLGMTLQYAGRSADAAVALSRSATLQPNNAQAHMWLGLALATQNRMDDAIFSFRKALAICPTSTETLYNLANALSLKGFLDEAIEIYRQTVQLQPNWSMAWNNLANLLRDTGRLNKAMACFDRAVAAETVPSPVFSNRLFTQYFLPDYDAKRILREHQQWNARHAKSLANPAAHSNSRDPGRRLRIGYFAADFRDHCQSFFTIPLFANHDRAKFEIFCYSNLQYPDAYTERIRALANTWRDCFSISDAQLADMIRADQIDIFVDLTMHMAHGRPLLFARKPAPIQVAWLAYPGTTGLTAMDYRLTDPHLDPPGVTDGDYSEKSIRLPDSFWCYDPLDDKPAVNALPASSARQVTFGSLNNFCKVSDPTLAVWSRVLHALPHSKLILLSPIGSHRSQVLQKLNVSADRVEFVARQPRLQYLETYHRIDLGLDTIPYNGHTTTMDSLWMGVPVVTLAGSLAVGRGGASILRNVGLAELIASDADEFVEIAVKLAGDLRRMTDLRQNLRGLMKRSALMDAPRFTRNLEAAFIQMWQTYCH